jgi:hypothetical protein
MLVEQSPRGGKLAERGSLEQPITPCHLGSKKLTRCSPSWFPDSSGGHSLCALVRIARPVSLAIGTPHGHARRA